MNPIASSTEAHAHTALDDPRVPRQARRLTLTELNPEEAAEPQGVRVGIDAGRLKGIKARLQVVVGEVPTTVGELVGYQDRQIVVLNRTVGDPVDLLLNGAVVARGHLVAVEGKFGVRICQMPRQSEG